MGIGAVVLVEAGLAEFGHSRVAQRALSARPRDTLRAVLGHGLFQIAQFFTRQQAHFTQRSKMLFRAGQIAGQQIGLADVLMRAPVSQPVLTASPSARAQVRRC